MSGIRAHLGGVADAEVEAALHDAGWLPGSLAEGLILAAHDVPGEGWAAAAAFLREAFLLVREAVASGAPVVVLVALDDLYGRRGVTEAVVACGLLSGARTAAIEARGAPVNVVAAAGGEDPSRVARWTLRLLDGDGLSGELVRVGAGHLGDVQP